MPLVASSINKSRTDGTFLNIERREKISHYALIYLMIAMGDSFLYDRVLTQFCMGIAVLSLFLIVINRKTQYVFLVSILGFGALSMLFVRATTGAMGPTELLNWIAMICVTVVAVGFNVSKFLERLIRLSAFLVAVSVVVYITSLVSPGIWSHITLVSFPLTFGDGYWIDTNVKITTGYYQAHGLLLYVDRGFESDRNVGIFREPAVYQVLLNSIIFVLLYMCPKSLEEKRTRLIVLFVVAVLTTKSATGYLVTLVLFFAYAVSTGREGRRVSVVCPILLGIGIVLLLLFMLFGNSSWLAGTVFGRFFNGDGFSLDASGSARAGAAGVAFELMAGHPLGCGYDAYSAALNTDATGYVAACLLKVAAVYGIPFGIAIVAWVFYPVLAKSRLSTAAKVSFVLMYLLATYFENEVFYTTLIFIPIFIYLSSVRSGKIEGAAGLSAIGRRYGTE